MCGSDCVSPSDSRFCSELLHYYCVLADVSIVLLRVQSALSAAQKAGLGPTALRSVFATTTGDATLRADSAAATKASLAAGE